MAFNDLFVRTTSPNRLPNTVACQAGAPIFAVFPSVGWRKFMSPLAMGFSPITRSISCAPKRQTTLVNLFFREQNQLNIPAKFKTPVNGLMGNTKLFSPFHSGLPFAVKLNKAVASSIALLLRSRRPAAIFRTVVAVAIDSINGHSLIRMPHISKKINKALPSFANLYTPTTVVLVCGIFGVIASLPYPEPDFLYSGAIEPVGVYSFNHNENLSLPYNGMEWRRSQS